MPKSCEVVEMRNSADAVGYSCSTAASKECSDCGIQLCEDQCRNLWYMSLDFLPALPFLTSSAALEARARGSSRTKKSLGPGAPDLSHLLLLHRQPINLVHDPLCPPDCISYGTDRGRNLRLTAIRSKLPRRCPSSHIPSSCLHSSAGFGRC